MNQTVNCLQSLTVEARLDIPINLNHLVAAVLPLAIDASDPLGLIPNAAAVAKAATPAFDVQQFSTRIPDRDFVDRFMHSPPLGIGLSVDGKDVTVHYHKFLGLGWVFAENLLANSIAGNANPGNLTCQHKCVAARFSRPEHYALAVITSGLRTNDPTPVGTLFDDNTSMLLMTSATVVFNLSLIASMFIMFPVVERATKFKHQVFDTEESR